MMSVSGKGFNSQCVVMWNGASLSTQYVSATQLTATVPASAIASAGTFPIAVARQQSGGGTSPAVAFSVYSGSVPAPSITSLTPSSIASGSAAFVNSRSVYTSGDRTGLFHLADFRVAEKSISCSLAM